MRRLLNGNGERLTEVSDSGEDSEAAVTRVCNRMLNCWRFNESYYCWHYRILVPKLSAVFATKSFLELGGDECDNLNFMNFKIDSFKIRKNSWILGNFKIRKIGLLNLFWICVSRDNIAAYLRWDSVSNDHFVINYCYICAGKEYSKTVNIIFLKLHTSSCLTIKCAVLDAVVYSIQQSAKKNNNILFSS